MFPRLSIFRWLDELLVMCMSLILDNRGFVVLFFVWEIFLCKEVSQNMLPRVNIKGSRLRTSLEEEFTMTLKPFQASQTWHSIDFGCAWFLFVDWPIASLAFHSQGDLLAVASGHKVELFLWSYVCMFLCEWHWRRSWIVVILSLWKRWLNSVQSNLAFKVEIWSCSSQFLRWDSI